MSVALVMFTDGRSHVFDEARIHSWDLLLNGDISEQWIFDDSAEPSFRAALERTFPDARIVSWPQRLGFAGTIHHAWVRLLIESTAQHIFHLEDDFILNESVDLRQLAGILDRHPHLAQIALQRQAVNEVEVAAGGVVACNPAAYLCVNDEYACWLEHRLFFTTNPSLYRRSLLDIGWPMGDGSEGVFTRELLVHGTRESSGPWLRFAFLGQKAWAPVVEHFGVRSGIGY